MYRLIYFFVFVITPVFANANQCAQSFESTRIDMPVAGLYDSIPTTPEIRVGDFIIRSHDGLTKTSQIFSAKDADQEWMLGLVMNDFSKDRTHITVQTFTLETNRRDFQKAPSMVKIPGVPELSPVAVYRLFC